MSSRTGRFYQSEGRPMEEKKSNPNKSSTGTIIVIGAFIVLLVLMALYFGSYISH